MLQSKLKLKFSLMMHKSGRLTGDLSICRVTSSLDNSLGNIKRYQISKRVWIFVSRTIISQINLSEILKKKSDENSSDFCVLPPTASKNIKIWNV